MRLEASRRQANGPLPKSRSIVPAMIRPGCDTVFAPRQFSWTKRLVEAPTPTVRSTRAERFMPKDPVAWKQAKRIARKVLAGAGKDVVGDATHYHATNVSPRWASSLVEVAQVGNHVFYR